MTKSASRKQTTQKRDQAILLGGITLITIAFVALVVVLIDQAKRGTEISAAPNKYAGIQQTFTSAGAPMLGNPDAKVTIMEFADFSCSHCKDYEGDLQQFIEQYVKTGKANLIYQPEIFVGGQYSKVAALAALCAGKQGHFWEMHDELFRLQATETPRAFEPFRLQQAAVALGLDGTQITQCITANEQENTELANVLLNAYNMGQSLSVTGTPAVFYSTDGNTFTWIPDDYGQPLTQGGPPAKYLAQLVEKIHQG
jgi:protein-disulfide isomerase